MSQEERYGTRSGVYSAWHRRKSTQRFVGIEQAQLLAMIDVDVALYVEYDDETKDPLALIETAEDVGQSWKSATVTTNLARRTYPQVRAYCLLYTVADTPNPADQNYNDISSFRVRRTWPEPRTDWVRFTPQEWATQLLRMRGEAASAIDVLLEEQELAQ